MDTEKKTESYQCRDEGQRDGQIKLEKLEGMLVQTNGMIG